ncbi:MAG: diadenylate cyclase [Spirochaetales bacterium]|nr:diadenylate cyclase [Spirochaetales bacterium]
MNGENIINTRYHSDEIISEILKMGAAYNKLIKKTVLKQIIILAIEISREGREGKKIGTLFVIGDQNEVLKKSQLLILDPLKGHPDEIKIIDNTDFRETVKELAQLDGAFIVSDEGIFISAARYIYTDSKNIKIPLGLGSRHIAAASITRATASVAVVVSENSVVRIFMDGKLISEISPELWLIQKANKLRRDRKVKKVVKENITKAKPVGG